METKAQFLEKLKKYNENYDLEVIGAAFDMAHKLHEGQLRKSGDPYFIHPIAVAIIHSLGWMRRPLWEACFMM